MTIDIRPLFLAITLFGCTESHTRVDGESLATDTAQQRHPFADTILFGETFNQEDQPLNDYMAERLIPIRANFKRINSMTQWSRRDTLDLWESTEGGEAVFYYQNGQLEKIITRHFGESGQQLTEYYLLGTQLSFVFEKAFTYNRPLYYDSTAMQNNNDIEAFDINKSQLEETRSYFESGVLIHQINNQDCGSPFSAEYLREEQNRMLTRFEKLVSLSGAKR